MKKNMLKNFTKLEDFISEEIVRDEEFSIEYQKQTILHEIAETIHALRKSMHLTQAQFAEKAHTTQPVIARLESGYNSRIPTLELLANIAKASNKKLQISFM